MPGHWKTVSVMMAKAIMERTSPLRLWSVKSLGGPADRERAGLPGEDHSIVAYQSRGLLSAVIGMLTPSRTAQACGC